MSKYTINQKNKVFKKLKKINITTEKDILNLKVADLKKMKQTERGNSITNTDLEIIWLMQEEIEKKRLLEFFINEEEENGENN